MEQADVWFVLFSRCTCMDNFNRKCIMSIEAAHNDPGSLVKSPMPSVIGKVGCTVMHLFLLNVCIQVRNTVNSG